MIDRNPLFNIKIVYERLRRARRGSGKQVNPERSFMRDGRSGEDSLQEELRRLREAVSELSVINEISTAIDSSMPLDSIIELIVGKCIKHLNAEQGTVTLLEEASSDRQFKTMMRRADMSSGYIPYHLDTQITGWILTNRKPLVIEDLTTDDRFKTSGEEENPVRTLLSVPLLLKGRIIGSLNVFNKRGGSGFTESDKRLLCIIATQSAQVIENARLYEEERSLQKMREELSVAYGIQTGLLPKSAPEIDGYDIAGRSVPARSVGGDYFDFRVLGDGKLFFCLGDISGKGMPAALLMSNMMAILRGQEIAGSMPSEVLSSSNGQMFRSSGEERFSTLFLGILDPGRNTLIYSNAGHNHPLLISPGGSLERLDSGGIVLGAIEDASYADEETAIEDGQILVVFSDGISEALDPSEREFGETTIADILADRREARAAEIIDTVFGAVRDHASNLPQRDDMTMVVLKRLQ